MIEGSYIYSLLHFIYIFFLLADFSFYKYKNNLIIAPHVSLVWVYSVIRVLAFPGALARDPSLSSEGRSFDSKWWSRWSLTWEDWGPNQAQVLIFTDRGSDAAAAAVEITAYFKEQRRNLGPVQLNTVVYDWIWVLLQNFCAVSKPRCLYILRSI